MGALSALTSQSTARTAIAAISPRATAPLSAGEGLDGAASSKGWRAGASSTGRSIVAEAAPTHASATVVVAPGSSKFATNAEKLLMLCRSRRPRLGAKMPWARSPLRENGNLGANRDADLELVGSRVACPSPSRGSITKACRPFAEQ